MQRARRGFGLVLASLPCGFAAVRFLSTGSDSRYVWLALVSTLGAAGVLHWPGPSTRITLPRVIASLLAASIGATLTGLALGTSAGPGLAVVTFSFGVCSSVGLALLARPAESVPRSPLFP